MFVSNEMDLPPNVVQGSCNVSGMLSLGDELPRGQVAKGHVRSVVLYWHLHSSMRSRASASDRNHYAFKHSACSRALKASQKA